MLHLYFFSQKNDKMSEGNFKWSQNTACVKVIFNTSVWKEHSVTLTEWDNLLMGK